MSELGIDHIDLLSVDVEGWEMEVMKGFDTKKYQLKIILLENYTHSQEYIEYMHSIGYVLDRKIEYNYIFKKDKRVFFYPLFRVLAKKLVIGAFEK